jgi:preprotein translocase subunit SecE
VRQELKKVAWPSREELMTYTIVVFGMTTVLTLVVFGMDWAFNKMVVNVLNAIT